MTPTLIVVLLVLLWSVAAVFWLLDSPSPRQTAEILLDPRRQADEALLA